MIVLVVAASLQFLQVKEMNKVTEIFNKTLTNNTISEHLKKRPSARLDPMYIGRPSLMKR